MLGKHLVLPTTGPRGLLCTSVLVMEYLDVERQFFLSITLDRKTMQPLVTYSDVGGLAFARLKVLYPERIHQFHIDYQKGIDFIKLQEIAEQL